MFVQKLDNNSYKLTKKCHPDILILARYFLSINWTKIFTLWTNMRNICAVSDVVGEIRLLMQNTINGIRNLLFFTCLGNQLSCICDTCSMNELDDGYVCHSYSLWICMVLQPPPMTAYQLTRPIENLNTLFVLAWLYEWTKDNSEIFLVPPK